MTNVLPRPTALAARPEATSGPSPDANADFAPTGRREGFRQIHDLAAGERRERGIHVVEARVRKLERGDLLGEHLLDRALRIRVRPLAIAQPEQLARGIEDAVAGAFAHETLRHIAPT